MVQLPFFRDEPRSWVGGEPIRSMEGFEHGPKMKKPSLIVTFMTFLEDFTPIKAVRDPNLNSFEDAMFRAGVFGLSQRQVFILIVVGLAYALLFQVG